ncbi:hypothetical protein A0H81_12708 [Grifola frondosa]|uniref:Uncharacterized protein n=1 Tax=Grifola frondosa TaxID=5627 RepID=A0A1C7LRA4_GRIFR|nr:hypothetical protein A0H81_12708 [Grifola frondosa]
MIEDRGRPDQGNKIEESFDNILRHDNATVINRRTHGESRKYAGSGSTKATKGASDERDRSQRRQLPFDLPERRPGRMAPACMVKQLCVSGTPTVSGEATARVTNKAMKKQQARNRVAHQ